jgi:hypothetical protein
MNALSVNTTTVNVYVRCEDGLVNAVWMKGGPTCARCPVGAVCSPVGNRPPVTAAGYYDLGNAIFIRCYPPQACVGGQTANSSACNVGYTGRQCGLCDQGFYRDANGCSKCPEQRIHPALVVLIVFLVLALFLYVANLLRKIDLGFFSILISFFQIISVFSSFELTWPQSVLNMFNFVSFLNLNIDLASPECFVGDNSQTYELKFYATLGFPVALLMFSLVLIGSRHYYRAYRRGRAQTPEDADEYVDDTFSFSASMAAIYLLGMSLMYLMLSRRSLELFDCTYDGAGNYFFEYEPNRLCYAPDAVWYWRLFPWTIISILVYVIGFPVLMVWLTVTRGKYLEIREDERTPFQQFLLLATYKKQSEYKQGYEFWEVVVALRKLLIVMIQVFFTRYAPFQAILVCFVFQAAVLLQLRYEPYSLPSLNSLEITTLIASIGVLMSGMIFYISDFPRFLCRCARVHCGDGYFVLWVGHPIRVAEIRTGYAQAVEQRRGGHIRRWQRNHNGRQNSQVHEL